jgi:4-carboxymuconolactone decarboxylase
MAKAPAKKKAAPKSAAYKKGLAMRKKLSGDQQQGNQASALAELAPDLDDMLNEVIFGQVWTRPGLELKMRSVAVIAALTAMQRLPQLKAHIAIGLNAGLKKQEIIEILIQMAFYAGAPTAVNAFRLAKEVFDEKGI